MNCLALPILVVAVLGADQKLPPPIRLETGGEIAFTKALPAVTGLTLSPDGKSLLAVVKDGERFDMVAWDIPRKSKTVITKGAPIAYFSLSPDGRSLLGWIGDDLRGSDDGFIWDLPTKFRTALPGLKHVYGVGQIVFSRDGTIFAIADGQAKEIQLWKRDGAAKWSLSRVPDVTARPDAAKRNGVLNMALTPDGKQLFVLFRLLTKDGVGGVEYGFAVERWDTSSGCRLDLPIKPIDPVYDLIGQFFFVAGDKTFCIQSMGAQAGHEAGTRGIDMSYAGALGIDISSAKRKYNLPLVLLTGASVSPDGRTGASVAVDWAHDSLNNPSSAVVSLWNFDDGSRLREVTVLAGKVAGGEVVGGDDRPFGIFSADSRFFVLAAGDAGNHIHLIDVKKAGARSSRRIPWLDGERVIEIEKAQIAASFAADAPIKGLFLLNSGEIAAVGVEPKAVLIWKIKTP